MAAPRAAWKGYLKFGSVTCGVKVIGATSEAEKIHFRILNRKTRNPVKSVYVDEDTGKEVPADQQVKGYELEGGETLAIEPEEVKKLKLTSQHTLDVEGFVPVDDIDTRYLEKPYYLVPADKVAEETYAVIRDALEERGAAARSCIVLYQRGREVVIRPEGNGLVMTTLRTRNEVVSAKQAFEGLKSPKVDEDMAEIAGLIIEKKVGKFDPSDFEDAYENALIELIQAKQKGKKPPKSVPKPKENVVNLADVLRKSLAKEGIDAPKRETKTTRRKSA